MGSRALKVYAVAATMAAVCGGAGMLRARTSLDSRAATPSPDHSPLAAEVPPSGAPATRLCPNCSVTDDLPPSGAGSAPSPASGATGSKPHTDRRGHWLPGGLSEVPGETLREKVRGIVELVRARVTPRWLKTRDDFCGLYILREASHLFGEVRETDVAALALGLYDALGEERHELFAEWIGDEIEDLERTGHTSGCLLKQVPESVRDEYNRLLMKLADDPDPANRRKALEHLDYTGSIELYDRWCRAVRSETDPDLRRGALANSPLNFPEARGLLLESIRSDADPSVRAAAVDRLGQIATSSDFRVMLDLATRDPDPTLQKKILDAVSRYATQRDTEVRDTLLAVAHDASHAPETRRAAISNLLWPWGMNTQWVRDPARRRELERLDRDLRAVEAGPR